VGRPAGLGRAPGWSWIAGSLYSSGAHANARPEGSGAADFDFAGDAASWFRDPEDGEAQAGGGDRRAYRDDPLYPRIARAVAAILARGKVVAPVDVLVAMNLLAPEKLEDWRRGRVPYLERVIHCNLTRLSKLLRILRFHAHDLDLVPSATVYRRWGKEPKRPLRFTKTGDPRLEEAYARHFVWPGKSPFHPAVNKEARR
jgi:hypothetical protein